MLTYLRRTPRWLAPRQYTVRDAARASIMTWQRYAADHCGEPGAAADDDWEPVWGSPIMRARADMARAAGLSPEGHAGLDLGMLWA